MQLYFFRHGEAEDAQPGTDDFERNLTKRGRDRTAYAGNALVKLGLKPKHIFSSPRLRARQTADILAAALKLESEIRDEVNFGFNRELIPTLINGLGNEDEVIFVGHEPDLSMTISSLIGGGEVVMKKGGLARVDIITQKPLLRGSLAWVLTPKVMEILVNGQ
jgi:phosphohistidine phosphatase